MSRLTAVFAFSALLASCGTRESAPGETAARGGCDRQLLRWCLEGGGGEVSCQQHRGKNNCTAADVNEILGRAPSANAQDATSSLSRQGVMNLSSQFVGFSYWWGGAALRKGGEKGGCRKIGGNLDFRGHTGSWGADCSGFVSKMWQLPEAMPFERQTHPYSTADFVNPSGRHWRAISRGDAQMADAFVYRVSVGGHVVLFEKGDPWGQPWVYESKGCAQGVVHNVIVMGSQFKGRRRSGLN